MSLHVNTRVPTPYGWTTVGDLVPGSNVLDELGYPVFVKSVGEIRTEKVYRVGLTNKRTERGSIFMTEGQLLCTWRREHIKRLTRETGIKNVPNDWAEEDGVRAPLSEVGDSIARGSALQHVIPISFPLVLPSRDLSIPPYIMGLAMNLHDRETGLMTCKERMWDWYESQFNAANMPLVRTKKRRKRPVLSADVLFSSGDLNKRLTNLLGSDAYRTMGLIPYEYLRGSVQQRMELLSGLIDVSHDDFNTYGDTNMMTTNRSSVVIWCDRNERRCEQTLELVRSLGYAAVPAYHRYAKSYTVKYTPVDNPYRYPKLRTQLQDLTQLKRNTFMRFCWRIQSVELDSEAEVRSFEVTSPTGMVAVSDLFLPIVAGDK